MTDTILKAILVDDEQGAIRNLTTILNDFCPSINIIGTANNVDDAEKLLQAEKPDVVFLDVEMPRKSGFKLLDSIHDNSIQVVFITAYQQYAIKAFEVSAADYLLKPISIGRLVKTVEKLQENKYLNQVKLEAVRQNIKEDLIQKFVLPDRDRLIVIYLKDIICMEAKGMYTIIHYCENGKPQHKMFSNALRIYEEYVADHPSYFRVHRSWIINKDMVKAFNTTNRIIYMESDIEVSVSRNKLKEFTEWFSDEMM